MGTPVNQDTQQLTLLYMQTIDLLHSVVDFLDKPHRQQKELLDMQMDCTISVLQNAHAYIQANVNALLVARQQAQVARQDEQACAFVEPAITEWGECKNTN